MRQVVSQRQGTRMSIQFVDTKSTFAISPLHPIEAVVWMMTVSPWWSLWQLAERTAPE